MPQGLVLCCCLALMVGCAGPWSPRKNANGVAGAASVSPNVANNPFSQQKKANTWSSAMQRASHGIANALTFKPRVVSADDPVSLATTPDNVGAELHLQLARQLEKGGNPRAAARQYQNAIELEPGNRALLIGYARLLDRERNFAEAIKTYRRVIDANPKDASAHNDLGLCHGRNGQHELARQMLQTATDLKPNRKLYRNNLATVLVDLGQTKPALEQLAHAHSPAEAHYNLGYLLYRIGQKEAAESEFQVAAQLDPNLAAAHQMVAGMQASGAVRTATRQIRPADSRR